MKLFSIAIPLFVITMSAMSPQLHRPTNKARSKKQTSPKTSTNPNQAQNPLKLKTVKATIKSRLKKKKTDQQLNSLQTLNVLSQKKPQKVDNSAQGLNRMFLSIMGKAENHLQNEGKTIMQKLFKQMASNEKVQKKVEKQVAEGVAKITGKSILKTVIKDIGKLAVKEIIVSSVATQVITKILPAIVGVANPIMMVYSLVGILISIANVVLKFAIDEKMNILLFEKMEKLQDYVLIRDTKCAIAYSFYNMIVRNIRLNLVEIALNEVQGIEQPYSNIKVVKNSLKQLDQYFYSAMFQACRDMNPLSNMIGLLKAQQQAQESNPNFKASIDQQIQFMENTQYLKMKAYYEEQARFVQNNFYKYYSEQQQTKNKQSDYIQIYLRNEDLVYRKYNDLNEYLYGDFMKKEKLEFNDDNHAFEYYQMEKFDQMSSQALMRKLDDISKFGLMDSVKGVLLPEGFQRQLNMKNSYVEAISDIEDVEQSFKKANFYSDYKKPVGFNKKMSKQLLIKSAFAQVVFDPSVYQRFPEMKWHDQNQDKSWSQEEYPFLNQMREIATYDRQVELIKLSNRMHLSFWVISELSEILKDSEKKKWKQMEENHSRIFSTAFLGFNTLFIALENIFIQSILYDEYNQKNEQKKVYELDKIESIYQDLIRLDKQTDLKDYLILIMDEGFSTSRSKNREIISKRFDMMRYNMIKKQQTVEMFFQEFAIRMETIANQHYAASKSIIDFYLYYYDQDPEIVVKYAGIGQNYKQDANFMRKMTNFFEVDVTNFLSKSFDFITNGDQMYNAIVNKGIMGTFNGAVNMVGNIKTLSQLKNLLEVGSQHDIMIQQEYDKNIHDIFDSKCRKLDTLYEFYHKIGQLVSKAEPKEDDQQPLTIDIDQFQLYQKATNFQKGVVSDIRFVMKSFLRSQGNLESYINQLKNLGFVEYDQKSSELNDFQQLATNLNSILNSVKEKLGVLEKNKGEMAMQQSKTVYENMMDQYSLFFCVSCGFQQVESVDVSFYDHSVIQDDKQCSDCYEQFIAFQDPKLNKHHLLIQIQYSRKYEYQFVEEQSDNNDSQNNGVNYIDLADMQKFFQDYEEVYNNQLDNINDIFQEEVDEQQETDQQPSQQKTEKLKEKVNDLKEKMDFKKQPLVNRLSQMGLSDCLRIMAANDGRKGLESQFTQKEIEFEGQNLKEFYQIVFSKDEFFKNQNNVFNLNDNNIQNRKERRMLTMAVRIQYQQFFKIGYDQELQSEKLDISGSYSIFDKNYKILKLGARTTNMIDSLIKIQKRIIGESVKKDLMVVITSPHDNAEMKLLRVDQNQLTIRQDNFEIDNLDPVYIMMKNIIIFAAYQSIVINKNNIQRPSSINFDKIGSKLSPDDRMIIFGHYSIQGEGINILVRNGRYQVFEYGDPEFKAVESVSTQDIVMDIIYSDKQGKSSEWQVCYDDIYQEMLMMIGFKPVIDDDNDYVNNSFSVDMGYYKKQKRIRLWVKSQPYFPNLRNVLADLPNNKKKIRMRSVQKKKHRRYKHLRQHNRIQKTNRLSNRQLRHNIRKI